MEQEEYIEYLRFLENLNKIFKEIKETELEYREIERRMKVLVYLFKTKNYELIKTMLRYYIMLEVKLYNNITKN